MLCRSRQPDFLLDIIQRQVKKDIRSFISWQFEGLTIIIYYNSNVLRELNILAFVLFVYYKVPVDNEKIFANTYYKCIFDVYRNYRVVLSLCSGCIFGSYITTG